MCGGRKTRKEMGQVDRAGSIRRPVIAPLPYRPLRGIGSGLRPLRCREGRR
jgi:hypothetical protein